MTPHRCDETCVCPECGEALLFAPASGEHACVDPECVNAHGLPHPLELRIKHMVLREFL